MTMSFALGSHRFNPQTGLWELVTLENTTGVEMSLPMVAEAAAGEVAPPVSGGNPDPVAPGSGVIAEPVVSEPELVESEEPVDILIGPWGWVPPIPPTIIEKADGLIIIGGPIHSVLEGGDGNDLIIAGASADHPGNWYPIGWCGSPPYYLQGDRLSGGLGQDALIGNDLNNDLDGGAGADVMIGGGGNDIYVVNDAGDRVNEYGSGGRDVVISSVSYILSDNVEELRLAHGAGDINGAGNYLDNVLWGNEGSNILSGGAGNDSLHGGNGDTFIGGEGRDNFLLSYDDFINYPAGRANAVIADFQIGVDKIGCQYEYHCFIVIDDVFFDVDRFVGAPSMRQDGADTLVTWGQGEIRLIGVDMRLLGAQDFFVDVTYPQYFL
jgi:Ca2+-binding RTX toxin-like protein